MMPAGIAGRLCYVDISIRRFQPSCKGFCLGWVASRLRVSQSERWLCFFTLLMKSLTCYRNKVYTSKIMQRKYMYCWGGICISSQDSFVLNHLLKCIFQQRKNQNLFLTPYQFTDVVSILGSLAFLGLSFLVIIS